MQFRATIDLPFLLICVIFVRGLCGDETTNRLLNINFKNNTEAYGILTLPIPEDYVQPIRNSLIAQGLSASKIDQLLIDTNQFNQNYELFLKLQGKRQIVPLFFNDPDDVILEQLEQLDGVLLTGGDTLFDLDKYSDLGLTYYRLNTERSGPYLRKIAAILEKVKKINDKDRYFPLYAICLGFEAILIIESDYKFPIAFVKQNNKTLPIAFTAYNSRVKQRFNKTEISNLAKKPLMFFFNDLGFLTSDFQTFEQLTNNYTIVAENNASAFGTEVCAIEHKTLPIYGFQFHPEKTFFEPLSRFNLDKSKEAVVDAYKFGTVLLSGESVLSKQRSRKRDNTKFADYYRVSTGDIGQYGAIELVSRNPDVLLLQNK